MDNFPAAINEPPNFDQGPPGYGPTGPRPFGEIPALWLKVFQMNASFFSTEMHRASAGNTLIAVIISAVFSGITTGLSAIFGGVDQFLRALQFESFGGQIESSAGMVLTYVCLGLFFAPLGFYIGNGLNFLVARLLGGQGEFTPQAYLFSLFGVPLGVVVGVLGLVPCVGPLVSFGISIFGLVLGIQAMQVVHRLSSGKAAVSVLWPLVFLIIIPCCLVVMLALMGPAIGTVFSNIIEGLGVP